MGIAPSCVARDEDPQIPRRSRLSEAAPRFGRPSELEAAICRFRLWNAVRDSLAEPARLRGECFTMYLSICSKTYGYHGDCVLAKMPLENVAELTTRMVCRLDCDNENVHFYIRQSLEALRNQGCCAIDKEAFADVTYDVMRVVEADLRKRLGVSIPRWHFTNNDRRALSAPPWWMLRHRGKQRSGHPERLEEQRKFFERLHVSPRHSISSEDRKTARPRNHTLFEDLPPKRSSIRQPPKPADAFEDKAPLRSSIRAAPLAALFEGLDPLRSSMYSENVLLSINNSHPSGQPTSLDMWQQWGGAHASNLPRDNDTRETPVSDEVELDHDIGHEFHGIEEHLHGVEQLQGEKLKVGEEVGKDRQEQDKAKLVVEKEVAKPHSEELQLERETEILMDQLTRHEVQLKIKCAAFEHLEARNLMSEKSAHAMAAELVACRQGLGETEAALEKLSKSKEEVQDDAKLVLEECDSYVAALRDKLLLAEANARVNDSLADIRKERSREDHKLGSRSRSRSNSEGIRDELEEKLHAVEEILAEHRHAEKNMQGQFQEECAALDAEKQRAYQHVEAKTISAKLQQYFYDQVVAKEDDIKVVRAEHDARERELRDELSRQREELKSGLEAYQQLEMQSMNTARVEQAVANELRTSRQGLSEVEDTLGRTLKAKEEVENDAKLALEECDSYIQSLRRSCSEEAVIAKAIERKIDDALEDREKALTHTSRNGQRLSMSGSDTGPSAEEGDPTEASMAEVIESDSKLDAQSVEKKALTQAFSRGQNLLMQGTETEPNDLRATGLTEADSEVIAGLIPTQKSRQMLSQDIEDTAKRTLEEENSSEKALQDKRKRVESVACQSRALDQEESVASMGLFVSKQELEGLEEKLSQVLKAKEEVEEDAINALEECDRCIQDLRGEHIAALASARLAEDGEKASNKHWEEHGRHSRLIEAEHSEMLLRALVEAQLSEEKQLERRFEDKCKRMETVESNSIDFACAEEGLQIELSDARLELTETKDTLSKVMSSKEKLEEDATESLEESERSTERTVAYIAEQRSLEERLEDERKRVEALEARSLDSTQEAEIVAIAVSASREELLEVEEQLRKVSEENKELELDAVVALKECDRYAKALQQRGAMDISIAKLKEENAIERYQGEKLKEECGKMQFVEAENLESAKVEQTMAYELAASMEELSEMKLKLASAIKAKQEIENDAKCALEEHGRHSRLMEAEHSEMLLRALVEAQLSEEKQLERRFDEECKRMDTVESNSIDFAYAEESLQMELSDARLELIEIKDTLSKVMASKEELEEDATESLEESERSTERAVAYIAEQRSLEERLEEERKRVEALEAQSLDSTQEAHIVAIVLSASREELLEVEEQLRKVSEEKEGIEADAVLALQECDRYAKALQQRGAMDISIATLEEHGRHSRLMEAEHSDMLLRALVEAQLSEEKQLERRFEEECKRMETVESNSIDFACAEEGFQMELSDARLELIEIKDTLSKVMASKEELEEDATESLEESERSTERAVAYIAEQRSLEERLEDERKRVEALEAQRLDSTQESQIVAIGLSASREELLEVEEQLSKVSEEKEGIEADAVLALQECDRYAKALQQRGAMDINIANLKEEIAIERCQGETLKEECEKMQVVEAENLESAKVEQMVAYELSASMEELSEMRLKLASAIKAKEEIENDAKCALEESDNHMETLREKGAMETIAAKLDGELVAEVRHQLENEHQKLEEVEAHQLECAQSEESIQHELSASRHELREMNLKLNKVLKAQKEMETDLKSALEESDLYMQSLREKCSREVASEQELMDSLNKAEYKMSLLESLAS